MELQDSGQINGLGGLSKLVIIQYYHGFNSPLKMTMTWLLAHLAGDEGLLVLADEIKGDG